MLVSHRTLFGFPPVERRHENPTPFLIRRQLLVIILVLRAYLLPDFPPVQTQRAISSVSQFSSLLSKHLTGRPAPAEMPKCWRKASGVFSVMEVIARGGEGLKARLWKSCCDIVLQIVAKRYERRWSFLPPYVVEEVDYAFSLVCGLFLACTCHLSLIHGFEPWSQEDKPGARLY